MSPDPSSRTWWRNLWDKTEGVRWLWAFKGLATILVAPLAATLALLAYSVKEGIPAFEATSYIGDNVVFILLLSAILVISLGFYAVAPSALGELDPHPATNAAKREKISRWFDLYSLAIILYTVTATSVLFSDNVLSEYFYYASVVAIVMYMAHAAYRWKTKKANNERFDITFLFASNFATYCIMLFLYLFSAVTGVRSEARVLELFYNFLSQTFPGGVDLIFMSSLIVVPVIAVVVLGLPTARKKTLPLMSFIIAIFVFVWPGGSAFVKSSMQLFKIGGGLPVELWLKSEAACRHRQLLPEGDICGMSSASGEMQYVSINVSLLLMTDKHAYVSHPAPPNKSGDAIEGHLVLAIPVSDLSSILYKDLIKS